VPPLTRTLYAVSAFFVVLGVGLFVALSTGDGDVAAAVGNPEGRASAGVVAAAGRHEASRPAESFAIVVDSNMFSPARTPPRVRFSVRPAEPEPVPAASSAPTQPALRVQGITLRSTDSTALIDANPRIPGAETYRVGDTLPSGALIIDITDSTVVVQGPRGRRVLRLERKPNP
jgi:hypothetical protein